MPKNIILLSDGTGNSAAKLFKTNVWRLYEALDLTDPQAQVACYDDGVGTSTFMPLAILGGALGFGLKRNVLRLYRFLCEHYTPGDRIYAFGFSRGAFTIRVLTGLILDQGVIRVRPNLTEPEQAAVAAAIEATAALGVASADGLTEVATEVETCDVINGGELKRYARWAYRRFRRLFNQTGRFIDMARAVRDALLESHGRLRGHARYDDIARIRVPEIEFLGLWDTVDAYGLPMDELTSGVDRWLWPLMMPEQKLSPKVKKACHALAIDDERQTFHPVLWDESDERQDAVTTAEERVTQVWFAGAHANVGGGYPNDALSYVSLDWMARQAYDKGVVFVPEVLRASTAKRDMFGAVYDSRRGLASSYRYLPRPVWQLSNGQVHEQGFFNGTWPRPSPTVLIGRPKIHESVFTRISAAPEAYAPIGLPERYAVVGANGEILEGTDNPFEHPNQSRWRARAQESAWNLVWWRRIWYFASVTVALILVALPFRGGGDQVAELAQRGGATRIIRFVGGFLPDLASPWIDYYAAQPVSLVYLLAALSTLMAVSAAIQGRIRDRMREIWAQVMARPGQPVVPREVPLNWLSRLRAHRSYQGVFAVFRRKILPAAFASLILLLALAGVNRGVFEAANLGGLLCEAHETGVELPTGQAVTRTFDAGHFCYASGLGLTRGERYQMIVTAYDSAPATNGTVADASLTVPGPRGFTFTSREPGLTAVQRVAFALGAPFRRVWRANWFVPVARVGAAGVDQLPLSRDTTVVTPRNGGELFFFMNDAIAPLAPFLPFAGWDAYYANNRGRVTVTVTRLPEEATTPVAPRTAIAANSTTDVSN
jgi:hypothetical protein